MKLGKWQKATVWFVAVATAITTVYDTYVAFFNSESHDTISRLVQLSSHHYWSVPFAMGALFIGHFFLHGRPLFSPALSFAVLVGVFLLLVGLDYAGWTFRLSPLVLLAAGAVAGRLLWPLSPL